MPMPNPFTPEEERRYQEIIAECQMHGAEYDRCVELLKPYREAQDAAARPVYSPEDKLAYEALEAKAKYHYLKMQQCQLRIMPFRDWQNVVAYAYEEGLKNSKLKKARDIAQKALRENLSIELIAELTDLSAAEIEALRS
jgi:predicted transposase YdaD